MLLLSIHVISVMQFQRWWVLKSKNLDQKSTSSTESILRLSRSAHCEDCEDQRANGTVQWAFALFDPNVSRYWISILCPGIFQKNYV